MILSPAQHPAYTLIAEKTLPIWNCQAFVYEHTSGTRVLSLCTEDDHKTFGIVFPTPPIDHTGLPHILEHCVLCGSEKFPVKEPFKEMLKTSLQTFLNAFTYPDRTCYPVSSQNLHDFYHLMDVYLDAVFFPRLTPAVLGQEGWRFQWDTEDHLEIQGVVFNEMKGVYASPESRLDEIMRQEIFPDTPLRFDYGGSPAHIPELSFDQFNQFHQDHYHPANALVGFYGNDDPLARLERLHEVLDRVPSREVPKPLSMQTSWDSPREVVSTYPAIEGSDEGIFCQLNWLIDGEAKNPLDHQMVSLTSSLLLNSPASPLRLALLDSGLGEDIIGGPLLYLRQPAFSAGLRGVDAGKETAVIDCVIHCLEDVAKENFRPDLIEGLISMSEFQMREMNTSNKGLSAILSAIQPWLYGGDPLEALDPEPRLKRIRKDLKENPRLFADWIQKNLLENQSRLIIILTPDSDLGPLEAQQEADELAEHSESFSKDPQKKSQAQELAKAVEDFQNTPDSPEATAMLPKLRVTDITPLPLPPEECHFELADTAVSSTEVHSNQIVYLQLAFDFKHLTLEELSLLSLYGRCLTELGTAGLDQLQFNEQVACHTGGINIQFETSPTYIPHEDLAVMMIKTKCLVSRLDATFGLLSGMLSEPRLGPADKLHQLILEERSNEESELIQSGNQVVSLRLKAGFSSMERASEEMDGVCYLDKLRALEEVDPEEVRESLLSLHKKIINRRNLRFHIGGDNASLATAKQKSDAFLSVLPIGTESFSSDWPPLDITEPEGLIVASPVQFVGLATKLDLSATQHHFSHFVGQRLINNDYLWELVRMKGGAYGSSSSYSHLDGSLVFSSYRDPHLDQSIEIYKKAGDWLQNLSLSQVDLEQSLIGTLGKMSPPERPSSLVSKNFFRQLIGLKHSRRERYWREILETKPEHLKAYGAAISEALAQETRICVLGGKASISESAHKLKHLNVM